MFRRKHEHAELENSGFRNKEDAINQSYAEFKRDLDSITDNLARKSATVSEKDAKEEY